MPRIGMRFQLSGISAGREPELVLGFASALLYAVISLVRHLRFQSGVDLAIFDQALAGYAAGTMPYSDIKALQPFNLLGDHFSPIIAVLAPVYRIWPHVELLLLAQAALFGLSVGLVTRIARRSHGALESALVGSAFALSRGLIDAVTFDFHEVAFAVPLLIWAIDSLSRQQIGKAAIASGLLMLVKEDSAFLLVGIGLWLLFERRSRLGVAWSLGGVASFGFVTLVIIPVFSFYGRYTYLDPGSIHAEGLVESLTAFVVNASHGLASWDFVVMVVALVAPTMGRALLSPILLVGVPGIAARLALPQDASISLGAHYNASLSAIVFLAALDAARRGSRLLGPRAARSSAQGRRAQADGAEVAADPYVTSHLTDRARVRLLVPSFTDSVGDCLAPEYVLADLRSAAIDGLIQRLTASGAYTMVLRMTPYAVLRAIGPPKVPAAVCSR